MTSKDGEYWRCWNCGLSGDKIDLFRIQNSLSYEEACVGLLRHYGIVPIPTEESQQKAPVWLSQDEIKALMLHRGDIYLHKNNEKVNVCSLLTLYEDDPRSYYRLIISRADEMIQKYRKLMNVCGERTAPRARLVCDYMGAFFDDSSYQKLKQELRRRIQSCLKVKTIYEKRIAGISK